MTSAGVQLENRYASAVSSENSLLWWQAVILIGLTALLYSGILAKMEHQWRVDPNFSHGLIVPFFSAFVVWRKRKLFFATPARPTWVGLPLMIGSLLTCVAGVLGSENFLSRSSLVLLIGSLIVFFSGWKRLQVVLFPWLFLFLMVPIPNILFNQITLPLQFLASRLAALSLAVAGVPVLREGNVLQLPAMPLEVAEACSGIRSLLSLGTMAIIYGYLLDPKPWRRVVLALFSIPIAVGANALRIVGTGLTVQYWDPDKGQGFFHEFSGWVIFLISLAMLVAVHWLLTATDRQHTEMV